MKKTRSIEPPKDGVIAEPVTEHQAIELLMLKAQVNSPLLPQFEPYENKNRVKVQ